MTADGCITGNEVWLGACETHVGTQALIDKAQGMILVPTHADTTLLQMALIGYEAERQRLQEKIDEIKARLGGRRGRASAAVAPTATPAPRTRGRMSAAARKRIAAAQKKRWAAYRRQKAA